jgi:hypothetical protein
MELVMFDDSTSGTLMELTSLSECLNAEIYERYNIGGEAESSEWIEDHVEILQLPGKHDQRLLSSAPS